MSVSTPRPRTQTQKPKLCAKSEVRWPGQLWKRQVEAGEFWMRAEDVTFDPNEQIGHDRDRDKLLLNRDGPTCVRVTNSFKQYVCDIEVRSVELVEQSQYRIKFKFPK